LVGGFVAPNQQIACSHRWPAVGMRPSVASVVKHNIRRRSASPVRVDFSHQTFCNPVARTLFPIPCHCVPHHWRHSHFSRRTQGPRPAPPKRRTKKSHRRSDHLLQSFACPPKFVADLPHSRHSHVRMTPRMIADQVPALCDPANQRRLLRRIAPDKKKRSPNVVALKNTQQPWRPRRIGPVIERKSQLTRPSRRNQRAPEQLRAVRHGPIGVNRRGRSQRPHSAKQEFRTDCQRHLLVSVCDFRARNRKLRRDESA